MTTLPAQLDQLRGAAPTTRHNARTIAALTANPGCARRTLLDAAAVDKAAIAQALGYPPQFGQSQFAITRGNAFEAMVKANGCAELLALLRENLGLTLPEVAYHDLASVGDNAGNAGNAGNAVRYQRTRQLLAEAIRSGTGTLFDHPMLRLDIAGVPAYLEPDVVALQIEGQFHVVEIKSFPVVDGRADPVQVASAARQSAVYVLALRELMTAIGESPDLVAHTAILVCTKDFSNRPTAEKADLRKQLAVISRQLSRLTAITALTDTLPPDATFEPGERLESTLSAIPARYAPECMSTCDLAFACRAEARAGGSVDVLGRGVCDDVGGIDQMDTVLGLADGTLTPGPEHVDIAEQLRIAHRLRLEIAG
ncbi:hypothetical protein FEK35_29185 [Nocardia cyriacigeorgica]|uniref:Secreted protein n=1 Tax=Nocardia cyriacigeorgica TaxID=135487 RepID=A0A5R8P7F5_9NOCA|nr:hypothetical protein [Nocardia cyriacigeorgica]TLF93651.1 hypothetical protein FEK35_29185 [Nocardia cyriacigeorgica]